MSHRPLMPGDWVEIRSEQEILATLDENGCLDDMPFMPEMLAFCGRRFRVAKRADKTCVPYSTSWELRRMRDTVHLALLRCSGEGHGGCQNGCMLFWKEAWLKRVESGKRNEESEVPSHDARDIITGPIANRRQLEATTRQPGSTEADPCYRCQATEVERATSSLPWWEPRQYWRDMRIHGVSLWCFIRGIIVVFFYRAFRYLKLPILPNIRGRLTRTPTQQLNLQPGELVEVKTSEEILATLDRNGRNRGMSFDRAMLPYCGKRFRVLRRVERTLNEQTGQMIHLKNPAVILNDVVCTGEYHRFCPRGGYQYWREIWLRRVEDNNEALQDRVPSSVGQLATADEATRRPRLLMLAYSCSPFHGSECGIGWNRAVEAARYCDTWVLCEDVFVPHIRQYFQRHAEIPGLTICFVPHQWWDALLRRMPGLYYLAYNIWQRRAYRVAKRLHREHSFDLVHHVNFVGYREPGYLWKLGVPFVWGPVGGTQNFPWRFWGCARLLDAAYEALRTVVNWLQLRFSRRVRQAVQTAAAVLVANKSVQDEFQRVLDVTADIQLDIGHRLASPPVARDDVTGTTLRVLWCGRLCARKALSLLIDALAVLPADVDCEVQVVGAGPDLRRCQRRAERHGVAHRLRWHGNLPHEDAIREFGKADVFVFTSLRDTSGTVLVEALAAGLPVVCLDHQGAAEVVTDACGIKIPVTRPRDVAQRLAEALQQLASDSVLRERLAAGARERAEEFHWSRLGEQMAAVYRRALPQRTLPPTAVASQALAPSPLGMLQIPSIDLG